MTIDTSREAVERLLAERDAALAEVARLSHAHAAERINWASDRHAIIEDDEPIIGRDYE